MLGVSDGPSGRSRPASAATPVVRRQPYAVLCGKHGVEHEGDIPEGGHEIGHFFDMGRVRQDPDLDARNGESVFCGFHHLREYPDRHRLDALYALGPLNDVSRRNGEAVQAEGSEDFQVFRYTRPVRQVVAGDG